jgi:glycosyltransferase involved in cell wall biosynthesis
MKNRYVLITSAKNEEKLIANTIESVISQTLAPTLWIIVNDGSTDGTENIIRTYLERYEYIKLMNRDNSTKRDFASKVFALNLAIESIKNLEYDFIGILDADITFAPNYYENMLHEFDKDPKLGLAGGDFFDIIGSQKFKVIKSANSVRGGIQLFRKECFDQIGEFTPLRYGGEDVIMEVLARKNGWKVQSFDYQMLEHHRLTGTGGWGIFEAKFREGVLAYTMGYHPLFQVIKSIHRQKERPYIISGILHFVGFVYAYLKREKRPVSDEFMLFLRNEQISRIKKLKI